MDNTQYKKDSQGRLVPVDSIKEIDLLRDDLVMEIVRQAEAVNKAIAEFKDKAFADIQAFIELSAEKYDAKIGGRKGNVSLVSFDGEYRVLRAIQENIMFDERIQAAKVLIDECLKDWTTGARAELKAVIDRAFDVDKEGNLNTGRILGLRNIKSDDPRWKEAMTAISDSVKVVSSKHYVRIYKRRGDGEYDQIPLDIAGV